MQLLRKRWSLPSQNCCGTQICDECSQARSKSEACVACLNPKKLQIKLIKHGLKSLPSKLQKLYLNTDPEARCEPFALWSSLWEHGLTGPPSLWLSALPLSLCTLTHGTPRSLHPSSFHMRPHEQLFLGHPTTSIVYPWGDCPNERGPHRPQKKALGTSRVLSTKA